MQIITSFSLLFTFKLVLTGPLPSFVSTHYVYLVGKLISLCLSFPVLQMAIIIRNFSVKVFGAYGWKAPNMSLLFNYLAYCLYSICLTVQWEHPWLGNLGFPRLSGQHRAVVLASPVGPWPATLAKTSGISQLATSKGEGEKGVRTCRGESMLWTWIKQNFPLLTREPEYPGSAAS